MNLKDINRLGKGSALASALLLGGCAVSPPKMDIYNSVESAGYNLKVCDEKFPTPWDKIEGMYRSGVIPGLSPSPNYKLAVGSGNDEVAKEIILGDFSSRYNLDAGLSDKNVIINFKNNLRDDYLTFCSSVSRGEREGNIADANRNSMISKSLWSIILSHSLQNHGSLNGGKPTGVNCAGVIGSGSGVSGSDLSGGAGGLVGTLGRLGRDCGN